MLWKRPLYHRNQQQGGQEQENRGELRMEEIVYSSAFYFQTLIMLLESSLTTLNLLNWAQ